MLGQTLILTDDLERGGRLARNLGGGISVMLHDLYGDAAPPSGAALIISDVSALTSESVRRLRQVLSTVRAPGVPFLALIHGNLGRGEIQATALGATRVMAASTASALLLNAVATLTDGGPDTRSARRWRHQIHEAHAAFVSLFRADQAPPPAVVESGADLVNQAIREAKVRNWLDVVANFDDVTHRHCLSVAGIAAEFARILGLSEADSRYLVKGALLHDIGKAKIPLAILNKPAPLTPLERKEMDRHPALGHAMLLTGDYDALTLSVVRSHHEYLDGSGYPDGLRGSQIPDLVRLITICDIFAALIEARPYKAPKSAPEAYAILRQMTAKLDVDLVRAFGEVAAACEPPRPASA
ncbi:cyclic di-GMP phosphodiesterase response regulator RpfG [Methylobacterium phyllosphaerae]|uniref:Cyclic di-GMP phosphodiesterase response regulator RpfG n=2 Tax=Pseudomonadota TaxID=1224 RepID=A0AAE8L7K3_9HYPH|nr:cyclic di-GMP phosphodiesterase response regulator RpfG [Methylobacterium phyllosphaerae]SFH16821.1 HDIG domain-containing protein [Methylobacterium phyllosphaerae]